MSGQRWIVVADSPFLPAHGGGEREHLGFLRAVVRAGWLALLVVPSEEQIDFERYRQEVGDVPVLVTRRRTTPLMLAHPTQPYVVASRPAPKELAERARTLAPDATGIIVFSYKSRAIGEALATGLRLPAVLRQHNREGAYHHSLAAGTPGPRGLVLKYEALRIDRDEVATGRAAWLSGTADISLADAAWRVSTGARNVVHVPPFALEVTRDGAALAGVPPRPRPSGPPRLLFLGALDVATNTTALDWFLTGPWQEIRAVNPEVVLDVVGRGPSTALRERLAATARVELAADVPDVRPYLEAAHVALNPAVSGSGVNIKVIEYLDAGIPLVSTSLATRGLPLRAGVDLEVQDDVAGFAKAVLRLLDDPDAAAVQAEHGRRTVQALLDPRRNLDTLARMLAT